MARLSARIEQGRLCFSVHVTSQKPGMAVIKLAVSPNLLTLVPGLDPILKHQFLVIWMQDQAPVINEAAGANLGDPTGNGIFNPIPGPDGNTFGYGLIHVLVKGTFPLGNDFAGIAPNTRSPCLTTGRGSRSTSLSTTRSRAATSRVPRLCVGTSTTT